MLHARAFSLLLWCAVSAETSRRGEHRAVQCDGHFGYKSNPSHTHTHTHSLSLSLSLSRSLSPSCFPLTRFENKRSCILAEKSKRKTGWCSGDLAFGCASNKRRKQPEQQSMHVLWRVSNPKQAITARTHKKRKRKKRSGFYRAHA